MFLKTVNRVYIQKNLKSKFTFSSLKSFQFFLCHCYVPERSRSKEET
ncbi:hypothetical protein FQN60_005424 [Etheostoma spectabile]|uniref:Uncharacterized protein n=1 Tax=Etheostoma spectabile TaxID=54343 RepID=A0A5J5CHD5_9PERO|nr:hypothetical protein FQN60_005424 [Etheostoma spectabile]